MAWAFKKTLSRWAGPALWGNNRIGMPVALDEAPAHVTVLAVLGGEYATMAELVYTEQALTDEDYRNFEQLFAREILPSFRAHYMSFNRGFLAEEDAEAGRWGLPVHGFNSIKYGTLPIEQLIERTGAIELKDSKYGSWAPGSCVPFAYDAGANPVFLSLRDSDYGCVYICALDGGGGHRNFDSPLWFGRSK
jgi:SMI1 / KNR4 family (SUKH-1)